MHADWIELFELFEKHNVRYLVIGRIAINFYGHERLTKDLEVWISPDKENAANAFAAAKEFGVLPSHVVQEDFEGSTNFIVMGAEPFRVDLIMRRPGIDFETAYADRVLDDRETVKVSYISFNHLITLKKAADRFTDQRHLQKLEIAKKSTTNNNVSFSRQNFL